MKLGMQLFDAGKYLPSPRKSSNSILCGHSQFPDPGTPFEAMTLEEIITEAPEGEIFNNAA